jgi:hypothetical protein
MTTGRPSKTGCCLVGSVTIAVDSFRLSNNELGEVSPGLLARIVGDCVAGNTEGAIVLLVAIDSEQSTDCSDVCEVSEHEDSTMSGVAGSCDRFFAVSIADSDVVASH